MTLGGIGYTSPAQNYGIGQQHAQTVPAFNNVNFASEPQTDEVILSKPAEEAPEEENSGWGPLKTAALAVVGTIATVAAIKTGKGLNGKNIGEIFSLQTVKDLGKNLKFWEWPGVQSGVNTIEKWIKGAPKASDYQI